MQRRFGWRAWLGVPLVALLLVGGTAACESQIDIFYECGEDGSCRDGLTCYGSDEVVGYCTAHCYQSLECPGEAVCYEGACMPLCQEGGEDGEEACPGGTVCNVVDPPMGVCQP